jgi:hypothetical protein
LGVPLIMVPDKAILNFYENLFGTTEEREIIHQHDVFSRYSIHRGRGLGYNQRYAMDKSSGPDMFTSHFYRACWSVIKEDILLALSVIRGGHVSRFRLLNTTFITLLPKRVDANQVKDYRPISLIHSISILVSKILPNRLSLPLPALVLANQSAFIKG